MTAAPHRTMTLLRALAMPFQATSLMFVVVISLLVALGLHNVPGNPVIAILLLFMSLSWLNKYAFALLDQAANGRTETPVASVEMLGPFGDLRAWVHPALVFLVALAAWRLSDTAGTALVLVTALLLPASIAAVAMSSRLVDAVNPLALWSALRGLGELYALLLAAQGLVVLAVWGLMRASLPPPLAIPVGALALLCSHALLGAAVHARRLELGFEPSRSPEREAERREAERLARRQLVFDEVYGAIRVREAVRASKTVEDWLAENPGARLAEDVEALMAEARTWPEGKGVATIARAVISHGLRTQQGAIALQAAEAAMASLPGFAVEDPAELEALARHARATGRRLLGARLIDNHSRARPGHPLPESLAALRADLPH